MSRERKSRAGGLAVVGIAWVLGACPATPSPKVGDPEPQSFLLVTLDTTRADHLEPYGAGDAATPVLRRLAAAGVVFEKAYATTPVTLPSHASLFTGLDPPRHGVRNNGIHHLDPGLTTLAELLRAGGLRTAAFVSAAVLERRYGLDQGFEVYDDDLSRGRPKALRLIAERPAEVTVAAAAAWLDSLGPRERFFLWVHLFDPHAEHAPPAPWAERFRDRPYDGEIAYADAQLGRLLDHPRLRKSEDVLVMVVGDHGESLGEHGEASHAMLAYDATLRIPWIVRRPRGRGGGRRLDHPVSQVDLLPTVLELLGLEDREPATHQQEVHATSEMRSSSAGQGAFSGLDGRSQAAAILGTGPPAVDRTLYAETLVPFFTYGWARLRSVRRGGWKLIDAPGTELYDVDADPDELRNLAAREPRRTRELRRELDRWPAGAVAEPAAVDPETAARLRSLGYLSSRGAGGRRSARPDPKAVIDLHREMERAEDALYRRDFEAAVRRLRAILERDPENLAALADLAKALGEKGDVEGGIRAARRAVELDPAGAPLHLTLATLLGLDGDLQGALAELGTVLEIDPRSFDGQLEKVRVLYRLERRDEALELLRRLHDERPGEARVAVGYAELVELPAGRLAAAEARLREAVRRQPFLVEGWLVLGRLLADARPDEAVAVYRRALEYQPLAGELHARLGVLLAHRADDGPAEEHLVRALGLMARPPAELHSALASIELRRGRWAAAEEAARRALAEDDLASAWNHLAIALEEQSRPGEAVAAYGRALAVDPGYWRARYNLGILLRQLGRYAEAASALETVLARQPGHAGAHYEIGLIYAGPLADRPRGIRHLRASLEAEPDHPRAEHIRRVLAQIGG